MGLLETVRTRFQSSHDVDVAVPAADEAAKKPLPDDLHDEKNALQQAHSETEGGVQAIEAAQSIWGKRGRWLVIAGLAMVMIIYEIDNSTVYVYNNYSTSSFNAAASVSTLGTATTIIFAVVKPPVAKISNVIGRGQTYFLAICFYVLAYILMASAKNIGTYAVGNVFYAIGQSSTNLMNDITVADITTARWRAFGIGLSFFPYLITPWVAAYITASVVAVNGIGWRWGIGMLAILMPFCSSFIIITLLHYQRRARKMGLAPRMRVSIYSFCSQIDLGGVLLFSGGLALVLVPMTVAATTTSQWRTVYIDVLIAVGGAMLIALPFYEKYVAVHPIIPIHYFSNRTIVLCLILISTDSLGFSCTHTYLYDWGLIARGFSTRIDTFYIYVNGVVQCLVAILAGFIMVKTRRYKYLVIAGTIIRTVGYGVMVRLRGSNNTTGELFVVQVIQGIGSGILQGVLLVPPQISRPHSEMPQVTALVISMSFVGSSVGACIAGGIYTNTLKDALWNRLGSSATDTLVNTLFNSITSIDLTEVGTAQREAISLAYSDVLRYMTYASLGSSIPALFLAPFLPNYELPDRNNLVEN